MLNARKFGACQRSLKHAAYGVSVAAVVSVFGAGSASAIEPKNASEAAAINARLLQTEMMVAALTCGLRTQYNKAIRTHEKELIGHGRVLRKMFQRRHGSSAQRRLDKYITQLANDASARSNHDRRNYCRTATILFDDVLTARAGSFDQITQKLIQEAALPIQAQ